MIKNEPRYKVGQKFFEYDEWGLNITCEYEILCISPKPDSNQGWLYVVDDTAYNRYGGKHTTQSLLSEFTLSLKSIK